MPATRGKCRWCVRSVNDGPGWWTAEDGLDPSPGACLAGPPRPCPPCGGTGTVTNPHTGAEVNCWPCRGAGEVPGPHWPWRHPQPA